MRYVHHGLTLLEVLASLVILALLAGVCVPMLRSAAAVIGEMQTRDVSEAKLDLEALSDAFVKDPAEFGVPSLDELTSADAILVDSPVLGQVSVIKLDGDWAEGQEADIPHEWLVFRTIDLMTIRYRALPRKEMLTEPTP